MQSFVFAELDKVLDIIQTSGKKVIYLAGASASGKSYIAEELAKRLEIAGKRVLTISSDNYYLSDTGIRSVLYGTFDHPALIDYALLEKNIGEYLTSGSFMLPQYSFGESRRTGSIKVEGTYDIVLVEGLYTISQLPVSYDPLRICISASDEDLIIRRLLRDPARVGEPLHMVVTALNNVFPMRHLYGSHQAVHADIIIHNDYDLLAKDGKIMFHEPLTDGLPPERKLYNAEHLVEYRYDDTTDDSHGKLIITEHYEQAGGMLKSVGISKTQSTPEGTKDTIKHISLRVYKPGVLTSLHNLVQSAGLRYESTSGYNEKSYRGSEEKIFVVEEKRDGLFVRYE
jgi:uridine kinase